jgi:hypothetical protein
MNANKKMPKNADNYVCELCDFKCCKKSNYTTHLSTDKHKMLMNANEKCQKNAVFYLCEPCNFKCSKKSNYTKHTSTHKHKTITNTNNYNIKNAGKNDDNLNHDKCITNETYTNCILHDNIKNAENAENAEKFICECGKIYSHLSSLYKHKKLCIKSTITENNIEIFNNNENDKEDLIEFIMKEHVNFKNIIIEVVKNNQDFQKQMFEMCKTMQSNITLNNNCNNNTFNMQVFLNEECKDAMNISDFVNSVNIQLEDLENVGRLGYATGISNIIVKELKMLDIYKRPIHCSDARRETFYVKDNDVWEKETPENNKMKKAIKGISQKNMVKLNDWRDKHPDCLDSSSSYNDIYLNLMVESCGGRGDFTVGENKILKNIAKEVVIKK